MSLLTELQSVSNTDHYHSLTYHIYTLYLFTCNNLKEIVALGYLFGVLGALSGPMFGFGAVIRPTQILYRTPAMLFWSWTNLLLFNLHNQRHIEAIKEDGVNKPWRPIPAQRLSISDATWIMYAMYPVVIWSSLYAGGLRPCIVEAVACLWYNEWRGAESPFLKNFLNAVGIACFLAGPLEIVIGGVSLMSFPTAFSWLVMLGTIIIMTAHLQDFRDQDGDKSRGRRTLPLVIGDEPARWVTVLAITISSLAGPAFWGLGPFGFFLPVSAGVLVMWNLMSKRTVEGDIWTWKLWELWMTSFFFLPLIKMYSAPVST